ncbi:hypothetical protein TNCV_5059081 [Trichonephila clavipes]|nr:hypothetical protein TNCV_5059081 [Trichonephila clavipes]
MPLLEHTLPPILGCGNPVVKKPKMKSAILIPRGKKSSTAWRGHESQESRTLNLRERPVGGVVVRRGGASSGVVVHVTSRCVVW